jgi:hypothetical protein
MRPNDDLTELSFSSLFVSAPKGSGPFVTQLRVNEAKLRGLPSWGASGDLLGVPRSAIVLLVALGLSVAAAFNVLRISISNRLLAAATGLLPAMATLQVQHSLGEESTAMGAGLVLLGTALGAVVVANEVSGRLASRFWP